MKIAVISDTHGYYDNLIEKLPDNIEYIIHLGDYVEDAKAIKRITDIPTLMVKGNNDYVAFVEKEELTVEISGKKIYMVHGHRHGVYRGIDQLVNKAKMYGADIVLFGHTHVFIDIKVDDLWIINPGSASYARGEDVEGFVILDLDSMKLERILC